MGYSFGMGSLKQLATCDARLVRIANEAIKYFNFTVVEGFRNQADQHKDFLAGNSKLDWPNGKHNHNPSFAMDCYPYPIDYSNDPKNIQRFCYMQGIFRVVTNQLNIPIRQGLDWNGNLDMRDEGSFRDYPHIELLNP